MLDYFENMLASGSAFALKASVVFLVDFGELLVKGGEA